MFNYEGGNHYLKDCVKLANELVVNEEFLNTISSSTFDMSTCGGEYIADSMEILAWTDIHVKTYYPRWANSKALGYFSPAKPDFIYLNKNRLNRSKGSIVSSLIHEMIHYLDHLDTEHTFGHGSNSSNGKENTAPYYIDNLAQEFVDKTINYNNTDNSKITSYISWYERLFNFIFRR